MLVSAVASIAETLVKRVLRDDSLHPGDDSRGLCLRSLSPRLTGSHLRASFLPSADSRAPRFRSASGGQC